jgi:hypothetical protein
MSVLGIEVVFIVMIWKKNKLRKITFNNGWFDKNMCLVKIMVVVKQKTCPKCLVKNKIGNKMT